ncbi:MAG TPA: hypothetical protein VJ608_15395 [Albitalea sp.]|nr:hypothetical protein [Albitalea sp.]
MNKLLWVSMVLVAGLGLAACGEQAAGSSRVKKSDAKAWEGANDPYVASGWSAGDRSSWESQLRTRSQSQNEYNRVK